MRKGFYHPTAIIILALIMLSFAALFFLNTEFFIKKTKPSPTPTTLISPSSSPQKPPRDETVN